MKNFLLGILKFLKNIFIMANVLPPRKQPEDVKFLFELQDNIKNFRLDQGVMPLNYSMPLEYFAQQNADLNYKSRYLLDQPNEDLMRMQLRMQDLYFKRIIFLAVFCDSTPMDATRLLLSNSKYRAALTDGFLTTIAIAKCGSYISIILAN